MYEQLIEIVKQAGAMIREAHEAEIPVYDKEGIANFVTKYDKDVQSFLIRNFRQILPEANFLAEEDGNLATVIVSLSIRSTVRLTLSLIINSAAFPSVSHGKDGCSSALCTTLIQKNCTRQSKERAHIKMERGSTAVKKGLGKIWRHLAVPDIIQMIRARQTVFSDMQKYFISIRLRSEAVVPPRLTFAGSLREVMGSM